MWSSTAFKAMGFGLAGLLASACGAGTAWWSLSYVNEPYYLAGAFHPTLQGAVKRDLGERFRAQTRLSLSGEMYGVFEPRRDPRAWDIAWGVLGGALVPFWPGDVEVSAGVGAILGRAQGELYYHHVWESGIFAEQSREYRKRLYADVGVPYQAQWVFGRDGEGLGFEFSGFLSQDARPWGIGLCWQSYLGHAPPPKRQHAAAPPPRPRPAVAPPPRPRAPEEPESGKEELEEDPEE
jgi:hypothetical protein